MGKPKDNFTITLIEEVKAMEVGQHLTYARGSFGHNNLATLRKGITRRIYTYLPTFNMTCERVNGRGSAYVKLTRLG